jgi:hypothetical protein
MARCGGCVRVCGLWSDHFGVFPARYHVSWKLGLAFDAKLYGPIRETYPGAEAQNLGSCRMLRLKALGTYRRERDSAEATFARL